MSSHYGHIELLRSTVFVTLYNALFVCVAAVRRLLHLQRVFSHT